MEVFFYFSNPWLAFYLLKLVLFEEKHLTSFLFLSTKSVILAKTTKRKIFLQSRRKQTALFCWLVICREQQEAITYWLFTHLTGTCIFWHHVSSLCHLAWNWWWYSTINTSVCWLSFLVISCEPIFNYKFRCIIIMCIMQCGTVIWTATAKDIEGCTYNTFSGRNVSSYGPPSMSAKMVLFTGYVEKLFMTQLHICSEVKWNSKITEKGNFD